MNENKKEVSQKILDKLKKLIRKHKGCLDIGQIPEAEAAMFHINRLLTEYNLSLEDVYGVKNGSDTPPEIDIIEGNMIRFATGTEFQFSQQLASVVAKYNYCRALFVGLGTTAPAVKIVGTEINVQTCQFLFSFLRNNFTHNGNKAAKEYSLEPVRKMNYYRDFLLGTVAGVAQKFKAEQTEQITGIMKWNGDAIDHYLANKKVSEHKSRGPGRTSGRAMNANAYYKGHTYGKNVRIHKGIDNNNNNLNPHCTPSSRKMVIIK